MTKEKTSLFPEDKVLEDQGKNLILFNDEVNSFDYVIESLVEVCDHTFEQAETCAWIAHFKGKCAVKSGSDEELRPYKAELINRKLTVSIE
ncbi:MAG: ATP-dependent Clp protease adaptor ClpS [Bacteroidales bacterium]|jgi:ATP-dependent Clp protease adaptor protein ClpS|nr:ATP-dependent Clp protease adaptor ClpS [Bacteroidales bacterium]MDN5348624.1 ATP-dependent Clp protease adaptor protein ClpS [Bacteroidales bacterium]